MPKLTKEQVREVKAEMVRQGVPVRFMYNGQCLIITTGELMEKYINVIHQQFYWNFTKETSKKIAKWLGVKAIFDKE
jgi:carbohydrate-binding DOMON domain-containing protein